MMEAQDGISVDELDMEGTGDIIDVDGAQVTVARNNTTPEKPYEDDEIEEYSYHDDASLSKEDLG